MARAESTQNIQYLENITNELTYLCNEGNTRLDGRNLDGIRHLRLESLHDNRHAIALGQEAKERHERVRYERHVYLVGRLPECLRRGGAASPFA